MENNIIEHANGTIIVNGGNQLEGCPKDWDEARAIELKLNNGEDKKDGGKPFWDFDCGFKLDYDGPLLSVNSRFYPPKTHYGPTWDGTVTISLMGEEIIEKKFDCPTLDQLKIQVEAFVKSVSDKIADLLK
jgi:hypothetical protein